MAQKSRALIKAQFLNGMKPNQEEFADIIDSALNKSDDGITAVGGKIGIATADPKATLHIFDNGSGDPVGSGITSATLMVGNQSSHNLSMDNDEIQAKNGANVSTFLLQREGGDVRFFDGASEDGKVVIKATGKIGIGTSAPDEKLHIEGNDPALKVQSTNSTSETSIKIYDSGNKGVDLVYDSSPLQENFQIRLVDGGTATTAAQFVNGQAGRRGWLGLKGELGKIVMAPLHLFENQDIKANGATNLFGDNGAILIGNPMETSDADSAKNLCLNKEGITARSGVSTGILHLQKQGGSVYIGGTFHSASDKNLKKNISNLKLGLKEINQLRPVAFNWKKDENGTEKTIGFIAQEVKEVIKSVVYEDKDAPMGVAYTELIPVLTGAIQEQQKQIESLEARLAKLEKLISKK